MAAPKRRTPARPRRPRAKATPARAKRSVARRVARKKAGAKRVKKVPARPMRLARPIRKRVAKAARPKRRPARPVATRARKTTAVKRAKKAAPKPTPPAPQVKAAPKPAPVRPKIAKTPHGGAPPALDRARRQLPPDDERVPTVEQDERLTAAARTGREELRQLLAQHTETSPKLTAGDLDAKWSDAYSVGDEAPGGDNPTPDQDVVDDIGSALGVSYADDEELVGSDKLIERDKHRWELDPASSDDWPHEES